jgi:transcriptional regulator with XRE-family HTH domain
MASGRCGITDELGEQADLTPRGLQEEGAPRSLAAIDISRQDGRVRDVPEPEVASAVGGSIRRVRRRSGLSMRELAAKADLSQPFLSNIENGRSMPSVATLYKLAAALGVPPSDLLPTSGDGEIAVIRAGKGIPSAVDESPGVAVSWLLAPGRLLEVRRYSIEAGQPAGGWFEHDGEDFLHLTDGALTVEFPGRVERLRRGDSLWHVGTIAHRWRVGRNRGADLLLVTARALEPAGHAHGGRP